MDRQNRMETPFFVMENNQNIEYKVQFNHKKRENNDESEIFVFLKSLPIGVQGLTVMCTIEISVAGNARPIRFSGVVHFIQNELKSLLLDVVEMDILGSADKALAIINMEVIEQYTQNVTVFRDSYVTDSSVLYLLDHLLAIFS